MSRISKAIFFHFGVVFINPMVFSPVSASRLVVDLNSVAKP